MKIKRLLVALAVLLLIALVWCLFLWFVIAPDFAHWHGLTVFAVNVVPPLLAWGGWWFWYRRLQQRKSRTHAEREALAQQEREQQLTVARQQHAQELEHLRLACDCRLLAVAQVISKGDIEHLVPETDGVSIAPLDTDALDDEGSAIEYLQPGITEALQAIYSQCPPALHCPLYLVPPADAVGEEVLTMLRRISASIAESLTEPGQESGGNRRILFLPNADTAADSVIGLFESDPDLPGAVILAFDSPWLQQQWGIDADLPDAHMTRGQGVFALFLTHPGLGAAIDKAVGLRRQDDVEVMTPYWEKDNADAASQGGLLSSFNADECDALAALPTLGRVHRAACGELAPKARQGMGLMRAVQALIERSQINAALLEPSFAQAASADTSSTPGQPTAADENDEADNPCAWLVHNAGSVDTAGNRLAAICGALMEGKIELDPIESGTNISAQMGDLGQAHSVGLLTVALARAASVEGAVLCTQFMGANNLACFFVRA